MPNQPDNLPPQSARLTKEELLHLRSRLPLRGGIINQIAQACNCKASKVSRVFKGELYDHKIVAVATLFAEKHEADLEKLMAAIRQAIQNACLPLQK